MAKESLIEVRCSDDKVTVRISGEDAEGPMAVESGLTWQQATEHAAQVIFSAMAINRNEDAVFELFMAKIEACGRALAAQSTGAMPHRPRKGRPS